MTFNGTEHGLSRRGFIAGQTRYIKDTWGKCVHSRQTLSYGRLHLGERDGKISIVPQARKPNSFVEMNR